MKELFKKVRLNIILTSIITLIIGIMLVVKPTESTLIIVYIIGAFLVIMGIIEIIMYMVNIDFERYVRGRLFPAILMLVLGIFILTHTATVVTWFSVILSILVIINSVNTIEDAIQLGRARIGGWWISMILAVLVLILGVVMLFTPNLASDTAAILLGVGLIVEAATAIYTVIRMKQLGNAVGNAFKEVRDEIEGNIIDEEQ